MIRTRSLEFILQLAALLFLVGQTLQPDAQPPALPGTSDPRPLRVFGFRDFTQQSKWDQQFLAVPDPQLARQHLKALTAAPHWASSPEDYATALYVADRFKAAGLQTEIVPFSVLMNKPTSILIEAFDTTGRILNGPTREHVDPAPDGTADHFQDDPRVLPGYNDSSPAGDITAPVVYANYGRVADFQRLAQLGTNVRGKIVLVRYGAVYRGVKAYIAQQYGAKGVLIYSDPADDGPKDLKPYPAGPSRPASGIQRGSVQFLPIYPGDPTTPGVASVPGLSMSQRIPVDKLQHDLPIIPVSPLSSADAAPILRALGGTIAPADWQGGIPGFPYRLGSNTAPIAVHMHIAKDAALRTIWDVIGKIPGASDPDEWVIAGNHRDAWVYGAGDPGSGTAAMLEAVHGLGVLLQQGWRPRRTIVVGSWDGEEEGMIGSTEWAEQQDSLKRPIDHHAVAYFNVDVGVSGTVFNAAAVPSLRHFVRQVAAEVPSPAGGTVLQQWKKQSNEGVTAHAPNGADLPTVDAQLFGDEPRLGELGSGSDYTPFLQHNGVPSTDIGSDGPFSVYHTVFDNYDWFTRFVDPDFAYTQQQARFLGLEILHMADADVLPLDYEIYAREIHGYLERAHNRASVEALKLDFTAAFAAADQFAAAAHAIRAHQFAPPADTGALNDSLSSAERALLIPAGLPQRPWYRHSIYAPGEYTGYEAVMIPGVNEALDTANAQAAQQQLGVLAQALTRAAVALSPPPQ